MVNEKNKNIIDTAAQQATATRISHPEALAAYDSSANESPLSQLQSLIPPSGPRGPFLPLVLLILDGWGIAVPSRGNAISLARTPNMNRLMQEYPTATLHASGEVVGLPWAEMGNSEVGHLNIGSGKIIYQNLPLINKAIADHSFFNNEAFLEAINMVKEHQSRLHILGLVSNGGVHSSIDHLFALLEMCRDKGLSNNVVVHAILDGRDTDRNAALGFMAKLETKMQETGVGVIASVMGRFWAMDRDNRWDRTEKAYNAIVHGTADARSDSPLKAIEQSYQHHVFDEELVPTIIVGTDGKPLGDVRDNDAVIFFNFRADRARQMTKAFILPTFQKFDRNVSPQNIFFVTMTEYEHNLPVTVAFQPDRVHMPVARVIANAGMKQLHIAETEKYAHVTFFFNGGQEESFEGEDRVLIPSPRVTSYDQSPAMATPDIAERIVQVLPQGQYHFIVVNFANVDMVGHTGNLSAAIQAVEAADTAIGSIAAAVEKGGGTFVITADHGNAEEMMNLSTGEIMKEHTTNPVPIIMCNSALRGLRQRWPTVHDGDLSRLQPVGVLSDVAPTLLSLMHLPAPSEMTSRSLIPSSV